ncbi:4Fe-4S binding protein [Desulfoprunum benzoelyticum]|uniref:MinD superfamily P-loop ATPase n=1 Tax=Desulfoprunum benzoelyticum TaxID=1506996 RepID=A0A840UR22_9BACT|nr:ATP-binding protein [Desulfoprunum benzoelyticum]MBB5347093.1 MinD superfamily P-loop ATPase [Desulfoprunum benzoelyticum]MBM9529787.1 4Fe-4S binding protein [Desulfoprunum benzoelyticum]
MKELVIVSGKGGTGKTSLTAAFSCLAGRHILCDADVDAADLHLLLAPEVVQRHDFMGGGKAVIDPERCNGCGQCRDLCRFEAIDGDFIVDPIACEGCGVCVDLCPAEAIDFPIQKCGEWFVSDTRMGPMVHARLGIAEENSGKLVSCIRREAQRLADEQDLEIIITDGPPGIGCPVIAAIGGATALLLVVEPTVSGLHDMSRLVDLARHFRVPCLLCINKFDLNLEMTQKLEDEARERKMQIVGRVPFDPLITEAMIAARSVIEYQHDSRIAVAVREIWHNIVASPAMNSLGIRIM